MPAFNLSVDTRLERCLEFATLNFAVDTVKR